MDRIRSGQTPWPGAEHRQAGQHAAGHAPGDFVAARARPQAHRRHRRVGHVRLVPARARHPRAAHRRRQRRGDAQHRRRAGARPAQGPRHRHDEPVPRPQGRHADPDNRFWCTARPDQNDVTERQELREARRACRPGPSLRAERASRPHGDRGPEHRRRTGPRARGRTRRQRNQLGDTRLEAHRARRRRTGR